jgi:large subunit ribosomal protein L29
MKLAQSREQLRQNSTAEIERVLEEERKSLFMSQRDSVTRRSENPKKIRQIRKNIARILTILRERELESAEAKK